MAILGVGGRLELQRTPPAPLQLAEETYNPVNRTIAPTVDCNWQHWWDRRRSCHRLLRRLWNACR